MDNPNTAPSYPALARGYLSQDPTQQFPTSTFREHTEGPVGWNFETLKTWTKIDRSWWFAPHETTLILDPDEPAKLPDPHHLVVRCLEPVPKAFYGSGFIIDVSRNYKIIGCYKEKRLADPDWYRECKVDVLRLQDTMGRLEYEIAEIEAAGEDNLSRKQKLARASRRREVTNLKKKLKRAKGLTLDDRPVSIALHVSGGQEHRLFEVVNNVEGLLQLSEFARPYHAIHCRWKKNMGEVYDEEDDDPPFENGMEYSIKNEKYPWGWSGFWIKFTERAEGCGRLE